jgi:hypothetical protein
MIPAQAADLGKRQWSSGSVQQPSIEDKLEDVLYQKALDGDLGGRAGRYGAIHRGQQAGEPDRLLTPVQSQRAITIGCNRYVCIGSGSRDRAITPGCSHRHRDFRRSRRPVEVVLAEERASATALGQAQSRPCPLRKNRRGAQSARSVHVFPDGDILSIAI